MIFQRTIQEHKELQERGRMQQQKSLEYSIKIEKDNFGNSFWGKNGKKNSNFFLNFDTFLWLVNELQTMKFGINDNQWHLFLILFFRHVRIRISFTINKKLIKVQYFSILIGFLLISTILRSHYTICQLNYLEIETCSRTRCEFFFLFN